MMASTPENCNVLGLRLDILPLPKAVDTILSWSALSESRMVCAANVHMTIEAWDHPEFKKIVNDSDMVLLDGSGLAIGFALKYFKRAQRSRGPDLMLRLCKATAEKGVEVGFYGGREEYKEKLLSFLYAKFPNLKVSSFIIPPFRPLSEEENNRYVKILNESGSRIIFVGIGCPKQEKWISKNKHRIKAVMIGVGGAFDQFSGRVKLTPLWIQKAGIEWFFRLIHEPRRLWKRNFVHSSRYICLFGVQWVLSLLESGKKRLSNKTA